MLALERAEEAGAAGGRLRLLGHRELKAAAASAGALTPGSELTAAHSEGEGGDAGGNSLTFDCIGVFYPSIKECAVHTRLDLEMSIAFQHKLILSL